MAARTGTLRLSEALAQYHEWQQYEADHSETTIKSARWVLGQFLRFTGDKQLASLTEQHVRDWFKHLSQPHKTGHHHYEKINPALSPVSFNFYRQRMKAFLDWARDEGHLRENLVRNVKPKKVPKKARQRPAPHVLLNLLDVADNPRDRAYIACAINTGLRSSELRPIRLGQVDLDSGFLTGVVIKKTGDLDDEPITSDLDPELRAWLREYALLIGRPLQAEDYLFPKHTGNLFGPKVDGVQTRTPIRFHPDKMMPRTEVIIQKALKRLDLPIKYEGTHTIRRAVARAFYDMLVARGVNDVDALRQTQALLHHALVATTERYLGLDVEREKRNRAMRGQPFLSEIVRQENVVPLRPVAQGE